MQWAIDERTKAMRDPRLREKVALLSDTLDRHRGRAALPRPAHYVAPCPLSGLSEKPSEIGSSGRRRRLSDGTELIRDGPLRNPRRLQAPPGYRDGFMLAGAGQVSGETEHLRALELCVPVSLRHFALRYCHDDVR